MNETLHGGGNLNSMVPIWRKNKNELTDEDYNSFYKEKFFDYSDPLKVIHTYTEGAATITLCFSSRRKRL